MNIKYLMEILHNMAENDPWAPLGGFILFILLLVVLGMPEWLPLIAG